MLAPLARRIALARPVATAFQSRPFTASSPTNADSGAAKELADFKRLNGAELFADHVDASARAELAKIRELEDELLTTASQEVEPIDWAAWKKEIRHPTIVGELQVMHESTPAQSGEAEKARMTQAVEETFAPMLAELEKLTQEAEAEAAEFEKKAEEISYLHDNIATMPVDEFLAKYPTVQAAIQKDIEQGKWFVDEAEQ